MFHGIGLTSIDFLSHWNTGNVIRFDAMFFDAHNLTCVGDLSGWDTSSAINMFHMFHNARSLTTLDVSGWDTSNVRYMNNMFFGANSLTSINGLSTWDTSNVRYMNGMFYGANSLTSINGLSAWDTSNVTTMAHMFQNTHSLISLDLTNWNISNVIFMNSMFRDTNSLTIEGLSDWDTSNVTSMYSMFRDAHALTSLDLSGWNISSVTIMNNMFTNAISLHQISLGENFRFNGNVGLPNVPNNEIYIGRWRNVGIGDTLPWHYSLTSAQLTGTFNSATMADTWVWETVERNRIIYVMLDFSLGYWNDFINGRITLQELQQHEIIPSPLNRIYTNNELPYTVTFPTVQGWQLIGMFMLFDNPELAHLPLMPVIPREMDGIPITGDIIIITLFMES